MVVFEVTFTVIAPCVVVKVKALSLICVRVPLAPCPCLVVDVVPEVVVDGGEEELDTEVEVPDDWQEAIAISNTTASEITPHFNCGFIILPPVIVGYVSQGNLIAAGAVHRRHSASGKPEH
jgi:hypothetical protein